MNFYANICNEQLHNHMRLFSYMARYICFLKTSDRSLLSQLTNNDIDYLAINNFLVGNLLFSLFGEQY